MSGKKKILMVLLIALLAAAIGAGIVWNLNHYVLVDFRFYPRNEERLDLREESISAERYGKLSAKLPDCEILWSVPLSGGAVSSDAERVTLTVLSAEDVTLLDYLKNLKIVEADGCQDYENLLALEKRRQSLDIRYHVTLGDSSFHREAEEITVRGVTTAELSRLACMKSLKSVICAGAETSAATALREACTQQGIGFSILVAGEVMDQSVREVTVVGATLEDTFLLASLPELETLHLYLPELSAQNVQALAENCPEVQITWEQEVCGAVCSSADEELDLSQGEIHSLEEIDEAIAWFPDAKTVFLGECGFDNETLAAFREDKRAEYKLVWTVQCGNKLKVRTDATSFMPVRENVYYLNDEEAYNLRYCEDMVCIDIGHMSIHNIDFVEYMPNLTYLILAHTQLQYIDPISSCKNLKFLELDWSPVRDLSPLVGCTALEDLNLGNTFADFEPIKQMTWLKNLWVISCSTGTAYSMSQALPNTTVQGSGNATVASGWRNLPNYYAMRDALGMHYMSW